MEHIKEVCLTHDIVEAIEENINNAEEHLEAAREYMHHPEIAAMYIKHAEGHLTMAEEKAKLKHAHVERHKSLHADKPHLKHSHDYWMAEYPDLHSGIEEVKFKIHQHKQSANGGRTY